MARQALAKALEEVTRLEKAAADQATKFEEQESNLHAALQAGRLREAEKATFEAALEHSQGTVVELQQNLAERDAALEAMQGKLVMAQALIAEEASHLVHAVQRVKRGPVRPCLVRARECVF